LNPVSNVEQRGGKRAVKPTGVVTNENTDSATLSRSRMTVRDKTPVSSQRQVEPTLSMSNLSESESSLILAAEDEDSHLELTTDMRELQKLKNELEEATRALSKYTTAARRKTIQAESEDETTTKKPHSSLHSVQRDSKKASTFPMYGLMKPPRQFDGVGDFRMWFLDASRYISAVATNEHNKAVVLDRLMSGMAASMLGAANPLGNMSYTDMQAYLRSTFSPDEDVYETVMQTRQQPGESPFAFKLRLEFALSRKHAATGCTNRLAQEKELLSCFKNQTLPVVRMQLAHALVKTIQDAVQVASQLAPNHATRLDTLNAADMIVNPIESNKNDVNNRFKQLADSLRQLQALVKTKVDRAEIGDCQSMLLNAIPTSSNCAQNAGRRMCKDNASSGQSSYGDSQDSLNQRGNAGEKQKPTSSRPFSGTCWDCEEPGHISARCPNRKKKRKW
jgi:hypothetical protein